LADDISTDLDVATVRREHIPGERTPTGILTRIKGTAFERILMQIEFQPKPETIELGFSMLKMGGESISQFSQGVDRTMELARNDLGGHDFSLGSKDTGITVHSNFFPTHEAKVRLSAHV